MTARWWQTAIIYQVYPRSFQDSDADGVGDLRGIIRRLPHLVELGIDAVWLSPIFPSPMADFGYDISDYTDIDPLFGTLGDFDALLAKAHGLGLKLILDLVPNHTSDKHPWFEDSRSSRRSPRRDWYIWRDPAPDGGPPNNWMSEFGGSAWEYDARTGQYYYHAFLAAQPDLNWRNPEVRRAMYDAMRFWLRRGVDGFRVDVIWHLIKDAEFRNNPPRPEWREGMAPQYAFTPLYTTDRPEVHEVIEEMRAVLDEFPERVLIGEIYLPIERLVAYYGRDLRGVHLPFNFALLQAPWEARGLARLIDEYEASLPQGGWPNWVLGNHDRPRVASRVGPVQTRVAAMLLLTLRGTPTIYYGEEIAMQQATIAPDQVRDPFELRVPNRGFGRDGCRTPMQWDGSRFAGFSEREPWLPLGEDHRTNNVENQRAEPASLYNLYRRLIALRRRETALSTGSFRPIAAEGDLVVYVRGDRMLVVLNLGHQPVHMQFKADKLRGRIVLSTELDRDGEAMEGELALRSDEGVIVALHP
ncbi:MAG TPA: alpha-amylase family glycosyl hydrolase [Reyranella sp.]|nr:alpha-amylase family glycosyl hydrolase [Reyranella sp.]